MNLMNEKILSKCLTERLIGLKRETKSAKSETAKRFMRIWSISLVLEMLIYLVLKCILGINLNIIPTILVFLLLYITMMPIMFFIKITVVSILGFNRFNDNKKKIILNIKNDLFIDYVEIGNILILEMKGFMQIDNFFKDDLKGEGYDKFLNFISSKEYIDFKVELSTKSSSTVDFLTSKENEYKDKMKELLFVEALTEKKLNKMNI